MAGDYTTGMRDTSDSMAEGRLKADVSLRKKKKKKLKYILGKTKSFKY